MSPADSSNVAAKHFAKELDALYKEIEAGAAKI